MCPHFTKLIKLCGPPVPTDVHEIFFQEEMGEPKKETSDKNTENPRKRKTLTLKVKRQNTKQKANESLYKLVYTFGRKSSR